jgi:hypothetical protein
MHSTYLAMAAGILLWAGVSLIIFAFLLVLADWVMS